jgi:hypothetical protein
MESKGGHALIFALVKQGNRCRAARMKKTHRSQGGKVFLETDWKKPWPNSAAVSPCQTLNN